MHRACSTHGRDEKLKIVVGEPEGKRPLPVNKCRWEDNIKIN
jgi:hypothetical protein